MLPRGRRGLLRQAQLLLVVLLACAAAIHAFLVGGPRQGAGVSMRKTLPEQQQQRPQQQQQRQATALAAKKKRSGGGGGQGKDSSPGEMLNSMISPPASSTSPIATGQEAEAAAPAAATAGAGAGDAPVEEKIEGLSPTMYDKLRAEATTPFRSLRMFVYGGFALGAGVGGFTAIPQLIKSVQGYEDALPLSQAGLNVLVDVGVMAACLWAWNFENKLKQQTDIEMMELRAKEPYKLTFDIKAERERTLSSLPVTFQTGENATMTAPVKLLREKGNQHIVVLAAPKAELADALLGARIAKQLFAKNDVVVVPVALGAATTEAEPAAAKGFGKAAAASEALLDGENYVAKPADAQAWAAYVEEELSDAVKQGNENARKKGIGVVMRRDGSIIRRGLGQPDWREVVAELTGAKKPGEYDDAYIPPVARSNKRK